MTPQKPPQAPIGRAPVLPLPEPRTQAPRPVCALLRPREPR
jgi:hypothetical protein